MKHKLILPIILILVVSINAKSRSGLTFDSKIQTIDLSAPNISARNYTLNFGKYGLGISFGNFFYNSGNEPNHFISSPYTIIHLGNTFINLPFSPLIWLFGILFLSVIITTVYKCNQGNQVNKSSGRINATR